MFLVVHPLSWSSISQAVYFCGKAEAIRVKVAGSWVHQSTSLFEYGGGKTVILTRIRDQDLFAREARYHPACPKKYTSDPEIWNITDRQNIDHQASLEEAHDRALQKVLSFWS